MNNKKNNNRKTYPAFGLLESLIAVFIVGMILITFIFVLSGMIRTEAKLTDSVIATNLAQEGIEVVRNLRDNNLKRMCGTEPCNAFQSNHGGLFPADAKCDVWGDDCEVEDIMTGGPGIPNTAKFERFIRIRDNTAIPEAKDVVVHVNRKTGGTSTQIIELEDTLYPWGEK